MADVSRLERPEQARTLAHSLAEPFRAAVELARQPVSGNADDQGAGSA